MIELSITVDDKRVKRLLKKMTPAVQKAIERFLIKGGIIVKTQAKALAPVRTARLKNSISSKVDKMKQMVTIGPHVDPYDVYVETGTRPHRIDSPVKLKTGWVYIGMHPGTKAQPYMKPALESNVDNLRDIFIRELDLIIQRI